MVFTPLTLSSAELNWQMMWYGLKVEVLSLKHQPSHRYLRGGLHYGPRAMTMKF